MRGLIAARAAAMSAVAAIDADNETHDKSLGGLPPAHDHPGVGRLTALASVAAIDDPSRIRRSRDIGADLGLVPRRYQSGEVDYVASISKCGTGGCGAHYAVEGITSAARDLAIAPALDPLCERRRASPELAGLP
jgi:transposase